MAELTLGADNFDEQVVKSSLPAMVDFWAAWCGPCKVMGPIVEELAVEYAGKAVVGKVDVDANRELSEQYKVMSIPTILFFKGGQVVDTSIGAVEKNVLEAKLNALLA